MSLKSRKILLYMIIGIIILVPIGCYMVRFWNSTISLDPDDWGAFGSYVGGLYSVIVALLVVYVARDLAKKDEITTKRKKAVESLYMQIVKINSGRVDVRSVNKLFKLLDDNKLYITDSLYKEIEQLTNYYLEVKAGEKDIDYVKEKRVKDHLRSIYNG